MVILSGRLTTYEMIYGDHSGYKAANSGEIKGLRRVLHMRDLQ